MNISEAKQIRIVDYLRLLGHEPKNARGGQYWYLSTFREEKTPSFKVNDRLNEWYDFGAATGGDLVELGKHLYGTDSVSEVLACIERHTGTNELPRVRLPAVMLRPATTPCAAVVPPFPDDRCRHRKDILQGSAL